MSKKEKATGFLHEFKTFALRGNVFDLAVGVIIGGAFAAITSSLIGDIVMPVIGMFLGGVDFSAWSVELPRLFGGAGDPILLNIGAFCEAVINFVILAFVVFLLVRAVNRVGKKADAEPEPAPAPPAPSAEETLLTEIRDLLKERHK